MVLNVKKYVLFKFLIVKILIYQNIFLLVGQREITPSLWLNLNVISYSFSL